MTMLCCVRLNEAALIVKSNVMSGMLPVAMELVWVCKLASLNATSPYGIDTVIIMHIVAIAVNDDTSYRPFNIV
jgi:hypothetical protein